MNSHDKTRSLAMFCDFENIALGVRDAKYTAFDIQKVLERLLLKGHIVVKKAYCDWQRYKDFKAPMHEAAFEMIEIPHVRQSGKNSADIRLVVDALDLCYTKAHVDTFVIVSGDSDFSPLVSKLRENNKWVIGVGVRQSTSDLLIANCDEFIFYDDLVSDETGGRKRRRKQQTGKAAAKSDKAADRKDSGAAAKAAPDGKSEDRSEDKTQAQREDRMQQALDVVMEIVEDLFEERGDNDKLWGSMVKQTLKRRKPGFNEAAHGFRSFGKLLEEAQARKLLSLAHDEKSGGYIITGFAQED